ncbi:hypothetical protein [Shimazuella soli]|nr:hypothetical protein [Shimazuella soli]
MVKTGQENNELDLNAEELQSTYEDIRATIQFLRSTEKQVLQNMEA